MNKKYHASVSEILVVMSLQTSYIFKKLPTIISHHFSKILRVFLDNEQTNVRFLAGVRDVTNRYLTLSPALFQSDVTYYFRGVVVFLTHALGRFQGYA